MSENDLCLRAGFIMCCSPAFVAIAGFAFAILNQPSLLW